MSKLGHYSITQTGVAAVVAQIIALVAGFGIIDNTTAGILISASTAVIAAVFVIINAVHALIAHLVARHTSLVRPVAGPPPTVVGPNPATPVAG
jgi:hypothetical protein